MPADNKKGRSRILSPVRLLVALLYGTALTMVFLYREPIGQWLDSGQPSPLLMLAAALVLALFPVFPYALVIGALGYMFGALGGSLISLGGTWTAALLTYAGFRFFFQDRGRAWIAKAGRLERFVRLTDRSPFLFLLIARIIPVVPEMSVDAYAAITGIKLRTYALASLLGKAPGMLFFALLGGSSGSSPLRIAALVLAYLAFLGSAILAYRMLTARTSPRHE
ncbi:VTT domain-containing protein [Paenibacillus pasadenensis]|uniref:TVP38/TMEM64 family protein n=1 Tax=Paenibacillus pasadenensis TaxID=217090 RepID=UPI00203C1ECD|nr:VTT domain-containing protein [Paenibacillus pasadenensis]MCM3748543.1 VTT domain-containing protein [Paenibacillus pasadenensis]